MTQHTELIELTRELREVHRGHADEGATTFSQAADMLEAQEAEIARLNKAICYEQNYLTRIGTHGPDCWKWGPQHYQCAVAEIARQKAVTEIGKTIP